MGGKITQFQVEMEAARRAEEARRLAEEARRRAELERQKDPFLFNLKMRYPQARFVERVDGVRMYYLGPQYSAGVGKKNYVDEEGGLYELQSGFDKNGRFVHVY